MNSKVRKLSVYAIGISALYFGINNVDEVYYHKYKNNIKKPLDQLT